MRVFVAGAAGELGRRVVGLLVAAGHDVVGLTRSDDGRVTALGARPAVGDALDAARMQQVLAGVAPDAVVQVPIALPARGPLRFADFTATNRLRTLGTQSLVRAAVSAGVGRYLLESVVFAYGYGDLGPELLTEDHPPRRRAPVAAAQPTLDALHAAEERVLAAAAEGALEATVLRMGTYLGDVGSTRTLAALVRRRLLLVPRGATGRLSWIHVDDAAAAVVAALHHGAGGEVFNVVDDEPVTLGLLAAEAARLLGARPPLSVPPRVYSLGGAYLSLVAATNIPCSNRKARQVLRWEPRFPTFREALADSLGRDRT